MKRIDWNKLRADALSTVEAFPVEIVLSICMFVAASIKKEASSWHSDYVYNSLLLIPLCCIISFALNHLLTSRRTRWVYYASLFLVCFTPFIAVGDTPGLAYGITWIIGISALLVCRMQKDNVFFTIDTLRVPYHIAISGILTLSLAGLLYGIYASLIYIFDYNMNHMDHVIFYLFIFPLTIVAPFLFCLFQNREDKKYEWSANRFFEILNNWIVSPALLAYTTLLYIYGLKILLTWDLPKGMLSYMISIYLFLAVVARACQKLLKKEFYSWFYTKFHLIAIPIIILFWVGILYRIQEYGFTEERVYLSLLAILISVVSLLPFSTTKTKYLYFVYFVIGFLAIFTYIPPISAKSLGVMSQESRLNGIIKAFDLKDPETGLIRTKNIPESFMSNSTKEDYQKLVDIFRYLTSQTSGEYMKDKYGYSSVVELNKGLFAEKTPDYIKESGLFDKVKYIQRTGGSIIAIDGYTKLYDSHFIPVIQGDSLYLKRDSVLVTTFCIRDFLSDHPEILRDDDNTADIDSLLYFKNDSCLAIIDYMNIRNEKIEYLSVKDLLKK